jgi:hypothetical protein
MDDIIGLNNRVTTECGHAFHCSCLMQNAAHNGFGCPYCRTTMAEIPDDSDLDSDDSITIGSFYNDEEDEFLTSFRMFHQQLNGQEVEEEDSDSDSTDWSDEDSDEEEGGLEIIGQPVVEGGLEERGQPVVEGAPPVVERDQPVVEGAPPVVERGVRGAPPVVDADSAHITQKLMERGITFEDLVKTILFHEHDNYLNRYSHHERRSSEIYGQFKAVMSRFKNEQTRRPNLNPIPILNPIIPNPIPIPNPILNPVIPVIPVIPVPNTLEAKTMTLSHREITIHNNL